MKGRLGDWERTMHEKMSKGENYKVKVKRGNMKVKGGKEERVQLLPPNPPATDQNKNKTHLQKREDKERHSLAGKILQSL